MILKKEIFHVDQSFVNKTERKEERKRRKKTGKKKEVFLVNIVY